MPYMEPEGNVEIPVVDMEVQEASTQFFEINDPDIPQDPSLIAPEVPTELDGPTQASTPDTEVPHRFTRVRSQPDAYAPGITGKRYEYSMTQIYSQEVLNPDAHIFAQEDFYQLEPKFMIEIITQFSLKTGLKE